MHMPHAHAQVVHVVWGLGADALDMSKVRTLGNASYLGEPIRYAPFQMDNATQLHVLGTCNKLRASPLVRRAPDFAAGGSGSMVHCWPEAFRSWRQGRQQSFPVDDPREASVALLEWLVTDGARWADDVGFDTGPDGTMSPSYVQLRADSKVPFACWAAYRLPLPHDPTFLPSSCPLILRPCNPTLSCRLTSSGPPLAPHGLVLHGRVLPHRPAIRQPYVSHTCARRCPSSGCSGSPT